jgi:hypothetical protein
VTFFVGHEGFEGTAEHFRVDRGFGPLGGVFVGGEPIAIEQVDEQGGEGVVGEAHVSATAFERCGGEEAAVEEWDDAECACGACAFLGGGVEGAEEEGPEETFVQVSAAFEAIGGAVHQELPIVIEPAFRFEEREKEAARAAEQGQLATFGGRGRTVGGGG